jgi:hypothetical protein
MSDRSPKLTRRQHSVPDFYLRQWADSSGKITCHDIPAGTTFSCDPVNALVQSYFYEEDAATPDNRVEKILSAMEGVASATFRKLPGPADTAAIAADPRRAAASIPRRLADADLDNLCQFAAYQYLRVQGAVDQKAHELQASEIDEALKARALRPGAFTDSGYAYVKDRFKAMKMILQLSPGVELITSDWPCFDMKDSPDSPLLGEEIGQNPEVVCYLPLRRHILRRCPLGDRRDGAAPRGKRDDGGQCQKPEHPRYSEGGALCRRLEGRGFHFQSRGKAQEIASTRGIKRVTDERNPQTSDAQTRRRQRCRSADAWTHRSSGRRAHRSSGRRAADRHHF